MKYPTKAFDRAVEFMKNISGEICIFHDADTDGVSSAGIILTFLKQNNKKAKLFCGDLDEKVFKKFSKVECDTAIFLDFSITHYMDWLKPFENKKVLVLDHHPFAKDINNGFIFVNPRLVDESTYISTAHVAFDVCKEAGLENLEWLMRIGDTGDRAIQGSDEEETAARIIAAIASIKGYEELSKTAEFLSRIKKLDDFIYNEKYLDYKKILESEIEKNVKRFEEKEIEDVNFFEVKSEYGVTAIVSNVLFDMYPDKTIICYSEKRGMWKASGRSRNFNIGEVFRKAAEGIGRAGGHPVASGGFVTDFKEFKKRILELIS